MRLVNKTAVVTGAGHGIGAAIAERLLNHGAKVAVTYRHDQAGAKELVTTLSEKGASIKAYQIADLADDKQCAELFAAIKKDFGRLDIVIANASGAGSAVGKEDLNDLDLNDWQANLRENLVVAVTTAKHAIKALSGHGGKIIFIGSVLGLDGAGSPRITAYTAGKAATHAFARTIAKKLAPKITVNVVAPGRCWSKAYENATKEEITAKFSPNKHGRPIEWAEIAQAVQMVLENDSIIGQVINVEAGFTLIDVT